MRNTLRYGAATLFTAAAVTATAVPATAAPVLTGGLVNITIVDAVDVRDVTVIAQVPIAVAANICDVTVAVLVQDLQDGSATCTALTDQDTTATVTPTRRR